MFSLLRLPFVAYDLDDLGGSQDPASGMRQARKFAPRAGAKVQSPNLPKSHADR